MAVDNNNRTHVPLTESNEHVNLIAKPMNLGQNSQDDTSFFSWQRFAVKTQGILQSNTGMLLVASSQAFFSLMDVSVKKLNAIDPPVPTLEVIFARMSITWICCIIYMLVNRIPDPFLGPEGIRLMLLFRGFSGFLGLFGLYYSLQYLSLSDATVITFLTPICTTVTGAVFLKETVYAQQIIAGLCSFIGVVLIARPPFIFRGMPGQAHSGPKHIHTTGPDPTPAERLAAVGIALVGVLGATGAYTTIRAIGTRAHALHHLVAFSTLCSVTCGLWMIVNYDKVVVPTRIDWLSMLLLVGIFGFIAQVLLTMGLQRETAGRGTMAIYVLIVFAALWDAVIFHTSPAPLSILGTAIILTSAIYVVVTKRSSAATIDASSGSTTEEEGLLTNEADSEGA